MLEAKGGLPYEFENGQVDPLAVAMLPGSIAMIGL